MRFFIFLLFLLPVSNLFSQIRGEIALNADRTKKEQGISITWLKTEEELWKAENKDRLEVMAVNINLASTSLPLSSEASTSYFFNLPDSSSIEILLLIEEMAEGETLQLKERISGKILFSTKEAEQGKVLLPVFNPSEVMMEWVASSTKDYRSLFTIRSLYVHEAPITRGGPTIGFGTALACHPNAACKQDSISKLISNSAVRIRMVMDEGIGWCTGAFVNNARNDKKPYILSAYHCTFEYTPQYDLWRFDLEYRSDSCDNPAGEPQIFSLTGCERKAGGQASDFLLLLLNEDPPSNLQITFAGWNRIDITTPDTIYLIHHPNADIRKFSTSTNKAVVHPNQIGWSEGYTTPGNHHFRFKFTEGGHQPGSSGGPVFDQDGYIVAQLHGGTLGCENENNAYVGRFSKSWNLGTTSADRLKDWLDPDNTEIVKLGCIENLQAGDLADIHGIILDPKGNPIKNVSIVVSGTLQDTITTNTEGQFFLNGINRNGQYHLTAEKNTNQVNGLNAFDLIAIQKHLLAKDTFDFPWQHIAADATNNNVISVGDILVLLRLLLGKITFLPSSPSWRFDPPFIDVDSFPSAEPVRLQIQGIKIGDVDGTADPNQ